MSWSTIAPVHQSNTMLMRPIWNTTLGSDLKTKFLHIGPHAKKTHSRGHIYIHIYINIYIYIYIWTSRLLDHIGQVGRFVENPAYGRHRISRPMRIVGPLFFPAGFTKGADKIFFCLPPTVK